ncbi:hypothetical protein [Azospirillum picis]|uniref:Uncharacterized protein n=1 Tax=Azospirillum picis TaxID=488438 RepID=A0ABU0MSS3_9PROT|nr:hypothetical protein [Azospirillum picis]MBP2302826.1 hypothetical protein [Azospirillum picis]MDQ0536512.1 hypothetical protein [Azospirillum picis]
MIGRLGFVLHLAGYGLALLLLVSGLVVAMDWSVARAAPSPWAFAGAAVVALLAGRAARHVLAGR